MKKLLSILTLSITMMFTHTAMAEEGYFGAGVSSVNSNDIGTAGLNLDLIAGLHMSDNFAIELSLDTSLTKAKASGVDVSLQTLAGYSVFRSGGGDTYFKAKAGFHSTTSKTSTTSTTDDGLAYGIGVGFGGMYEVEYTILKAKSSTGNADLNKITFTVLF